MSQGSESDPAKRVADLPQKRAELDREIARIQGGDVPLLDDSALQDRFQHFTQGARELLGTWICLFYYCQTGTTWQYRRHSIVGHMHVCESAKSLLDAF